MSFRICKVMARAAAWVLALVLVIAFAGPVRAAASLLDTSFNPVVSGTTSLVMQSDGKILAAGSFTAAGGSNSPYLRLARFNADGTLDPTFANPNINNVVSGIALQADGKILVSGTFTTAGASSSAYARLARFNVDGTIDTGFANPNLNNAAVGVTVQGDGKILVYGNFSTAGANNDSYPRLARFNSDGTLDTSFTNPQVNTTISALAVQSDGAILIGGLFTTVGGSPRSRAARLRADGTLDPGFDPSFNDTVSALTVMSDGRIMAGGTFTSVGPVPTTYRRLVRLHADGTIDTSFTDPNVGHQVYLIHMQSDGRMLVGGGFQTVGSVTSKYLARLNADGTPDASFPDPDLSSTVWGIAQRSETSFVTAGGSIPGRIRRFFTGLHALSLSTANGSVTSNPAGLACSAACTTAFPWNATVTLAATPVPGGRFVGWGGDCSGTANPLTISLAADMACTANFIAPFTPNPPPSFVSATTPVPAVANASTVGAGSGSLSFASSFVNPQALTFTATQDGGTALPSWLTFNPSTVSFSYDVPIPTTLPIQPLADSAGRADARAAWANTIYPLLVRVAQVPVTLTATGDGQSYAMPIQMGFFAPRSPVAISAVSLSLDGAIGNGRSGRSALSWDGAQVVFETAATNIFPASPNGFTDIVRYHALSGDRDRLSQTAIPGGGVANAAYGPSVNPAVSSDGRHAAFASDAPGITLTPGNRARQIYRVSLGYPRHALNAQVTSAPDLVSISADGVVGNGTSDNPAISQDGRYVVFESAATNFSVGADGTRQVWRKDLQTGSLDPVSNGPGSGASISWDGRYVAFETGSRIYLRDMASNAIRQVAAGSAPRLAARADRLAFVAADQIAVADLPSGTTRMLTAGDQPDISADGRFVAYRFDGQIYVRDVERGVSALVTQTATAAPGSGASWNPALSGDGGTISFGSDARDLVNGSPASGQLYIAANPLPLPAKTGYWYIAAIGGGQGWAIERWGNKAYVGGLAYDAQGRSQWLAGLCTFSALTCSGTLTTGPAFAIATAENGASATLVIGGAAAQTLTMFPIGGSRASGYAGLPQAGWWYDAEAADGIGYFLGIDTQPQANGSVAQVGYLAVLAYDASGRQVWQTAQAALGADMNFTGMLTQYSGGAPFGATAVGATASAAAIGQVRLIFDGTDRARVSLPTGRTANLVRFRF